MGRPSNRTQRRAEIVAGLQSVMAERGYEAASVNEIARAAGLSSGLVHYHFATKLEILVALVEALASELEGKLESRLEGLEGGRARLEVALDLHLAQDDADPSALACWVAIGAEAIRLPEVQAAYAAALARRQVLFTALAREALSEAGESPRRARAAAAGLSALIEGYFQVAVAVPDAIPSGSASRTAKRMLSGLLGGSGAV